MKLIGVLSLLLILILTCGIAGAEVPPDPLDIVNTTGTFWVNNTWDSPEAVPVTTTIRYLISSSGTGAFTGFNWTGSAWQADSAITSGIGSAASQSIASSFYMNAELYFIYGRIWGNTISGFKWDGSTWQSDNPIISGISVPGIGSTKVTVFYIDKWYLICGDSNSLAGYNWTGSAWQSDSAIASGLSHSGFDSPEIFNMSSTLYCVMGKAHGTYAGYNWTGSAWQADSAIASGLDDLGYYSSSTIFQEDGIWYLIAGGSAGGFQGYNWTGSTWQQDSAINDSLSISGDNSVPTSFTITSDIVAVTDSYNVSVNGTWYNGTTDTFYNDTYSAHGWQNITVFGYNESDGGALSAGSADQNTRIPNNPITITNTGNWSGTVGDTVDVDYNSADLDDDTPVFSCNRSDLFTDFNTATGVGSWVVTNGTFYVDFGVSDGWGSIDNFTMVITSAPADDTETFVDPIFVVVGGILAAVGAGAFAVKSWADRRRRRR